MSREKIPWDSECYGKPNLGEASLYHSTINFVLDLFKLLSKLLIIEGQSFGLHLGTDILLQVIRRSSKNKDIKALVSVSTTGQPWILVRLWAKKTRCKGSRAPANFAQAGLLHNSPETSPCQIPEAISPSKSWGGSSAHRFSRGTSASLKPHPPYQVKRRTSINECWERRKGI